jgi:hypothetical protein
VTSKRRDRLGWHSEVVPATIRRGANKDPAGLRATGVAACRRQRRTSSPCPVGPVRPRRTSRGRRWPISQRSLQARSQAQLNGLFLSREAVNRTCEPRTEESRSTGEGDLGGREGINPGAFLGGQCTAGGPSRHCSRRAREQAPAQTPTCRVPAGRRALSGGQAPSTANAMHQTGDGAGGCGNWANVRA